MTTPGDGGKTVVVAGGSGFVGTALAHHLSQCGYRVRILSRTPRDSDSFIHWSPKEGLLPAKDLENSLAVINLAGANIASGRWSEKRKEIILESRIRSTELLSQTISKLKHPPKVFLSASAIGYYGPNQPEPLTENAPRGEGFLSSVCKRWEDAALLPQGVTRLVIPRIGIVFGASGGILQKVKLPFQLGLGGRLGSGEQVMSWIGLTDVVHAFEFLITNEDAEGIVNLVAPNPITNREFTELVGQALNRPTPFPVPAFMLRLIFGEMADEMLLASTHAAAERLLKLGYQFFEVNALEAIKGAVSPKSSENA